MFQIAHIESGRTWFGSQFPSVPNPLFVSLVRIKSPKRVNNMPRLGGSLAGLTVMRPGSRLCSCQ